MEEYVDIFVGGVLAMNEQQEKEFIEQAFQTLKERGWLPEPLEPTGITDQIIAAFEETYQIKLPSLYKAFLQSYKMNNDCFDDFWCIAIVGDELRPWPITLFDMSPTVDSNFLSSSMIQFRKCATDIYSYSAGAEQYRKYLPIGYWDSDWLLWDLSKPLEQVDEEDESTWALVTFAHDEEWDKKYWAQGGCPCVPDFKTLLEWYFCGTLEAEFEEDNGVKVTRERMRTWDFRWHWYEDRWKEKA